MVYRVLLWLKIAFVPCLLQLLWLFLECPMALQHFSAKIVMKSVSWEFASAAKLSWSHMESPFVTLLQFVTFCCTKTAKVFKNSHKFSSKIANERFSHFVMQSQFCHHMALHGNSLVKCHAKP